LRTEEETYSLIDQYLQGQLPVEHPFHGEMTSNRNLAQEVEVQRLLTEAVIDHQLVKIRNEIGLLKPTYLAKHKNDFRLAKSGIALVLGLGMASYWSYISTSSNTPVAIVPQEQTNQTETTPVPVKPTQSVVRKPILLPKKQSSPQVTTLPEQAQVEQTEEATPSTITVEQPSMAEHSSEAKKEIVIEPSAATQSNQALKVESVTIEEKKPEAMPASKKVEMGSHVFEPLRETWDVPLDTEKSGRLSIFDKNGQLVYKRDFAKMEHLSWDGHATNGGLLASNVYVYWIEYQDGSTQQGTVTLSY
jgi:hypothetical protein